MELRVIGCDGSYPAAQGACSAYLVTTKGGNRLLLDCGTGALPRLMALMDPAQLDAIIVTHWHNDHASDLLTLRYYLQIHQKRLKLFAPKNDQLLRLLCVCDEFDMQDIDTGFDEGGVSLQALPVQHPVPAFAVKVVADGKTLVYTGDTASWEGMAPFCQRADLLVCDATFTTQQYHPELPHLSAALAAQLAQAAQVKQLLLTHCPPSSDWRTLLQEARQVYPTAQSAQALACYSV